MTTYALTDAKVPAIVRRALEQALMADKPSTLFGRGPGAIRAILTRQGAWSVSVISPDGFFHNPTTRGLTTDQAVEAITHYAQGRA